MDWCKLDTTYYHDGALLRAGEAAEILFMRCIAYSGAKETRGRVPRHVLPLLTPSRSASRVSALLREKLLVEDGDDFVIRSWDKWQAGLDSESDRRRKEREKKAKQRAAVPGTAGDTSPGQSPESPETCPGDSPAMSPPLEVEGELEGSKPSAAAPPRALSIARDPIGTQAVVAAYLEGAENADLPKPEKTLVSRVGKQAKAMLATTGHDSLVTAARACGANGWSDLATQLQRDAVARKQQARGPMDYVEVAPRQW